MARPEGMAARGDVCLVTGLSGGVGPALARDLLLLGAAKVALHHPSLADVVTPEDVECAGGLLQANDVGDPIAAAVGRRLRAYGDVEVLGHEALEGDARDLAGATVVCACDGAGPLSALCSIGEGARRASRAFVLAQARGLVGTVFVDPGEEPHDTLYRALRPREDARPPSSAPPTSARHRQLHAAFLRAHPETRWLLAPKDDDKARNARDDHHHDALDGADADGLAPAPFAARVAEVAAAELARALRPDASSASSRWIHVDALHLRASDQDAAVAAVAAAAAALRVTAGDSGYEPIPTGASEEADATDAGDESEPEGRDAKATSPTLTSLVGAATRERLAGFRALVFGAETPGGGAAIAALVGAGVGVVDVAEGRSISSETSTTEADAATTAAHPLLRAVNHGDAERASIAASCAAVAERLALAAGTSRVAAVAVPDDEAERAAFVASYDVAVCAWMSEEARVATARTCEAAKTPLTTETGASAALEVIRIARSIEMGE